MSFSKPSDEIQKAIASKKTEDEEVEEALIDKSAADWMKEQIDKEVVYALTLLQFIVRLASRLLEPIAFQFQ